MKEIVIRKGVYGQRTAAGRVTPVARGEHTTVSDEEAARLVALGVAACADTPTTAPVPPYDGEELPGVPTDTPDEKAAAQPDTNGEGDKPDSAEVARLERMPKADLEQLAQDMGVDITGAKNNRERAVLIAAADVAGDGEDAPELNAGDIVQ